ncbi:hypothetical protein LIER_09462 [Lithospermum erythrorhizon]|uniref:ATP synthase F0 subunit 8 n=1 Tax=Lithospermum erythrorhizon TaxID=34254 RepID=A0AAV3PHD6_LITER
MASRIGNVPTLLVFLGGVYSTFMLFMPLLRRYQNKLNMIKDDSSSWLIDQKDISFYISRFFSNHYTTGLDISPSPFLAHQIYTPLQESITCPFQTRSQMRKLSLPSKASNPSKRLGLLASIQSSSTNIGEPLRGLPSKPYTKPSPPLSLSKPLTQPSFALSQKPIDPKQSINSGPSTFVTPCTISLEKSSSAVSDHTSTRSLTPLKLVSFQGDKVVIM